MKKKILKFQKEVLGQKNTWHQGTEREVGRRAGSFWFKDFFWCGPFLKSNWICYNIASVFFSLLLLIFFGCKECGILAPRSGTEPTTPALEAKSQPLNHKGSPRAGSFWIRESPQLLTENKESKKSKERFFSLLISLFSSSFHYDTTN